MKLVQFVLKSSKDTKKVGIQIQNDILDLTEGLKVTSALEFIQGGNVMLEKAQR